MEIFFPLSIPQKRSQRKACRACTLGLTVFPLCLILIAVILDYSGIDLWWESLFHNDAAQIWPFRDHWLFEGVIHEGGRKLNICMAALWLAAFAGASLRPSLKKYKKPLIYFLTATAAGPLIVGGLKAVTHIYTPWDIAPFSGPFPYIHLFDPAPTGLPAGGAFPAGHASGGYAFVSLYFFMDIPALSLKRMKPMGLMAGLILGGIYGIGQQVRGAHFPSHDLFSLVICWYSAFFLYFLFYPKQWRKAFPWLIRFLKPRRPVLP